MCLLDFHHEDGHYFKHGGWARGVGDTPKRITQVHSIFKSSCLSMNYNKHRTTELNLQPLHHWLKKPKNPEKWMVWNLYQCRLFFFWGYFHSQSGGVFSSNESTGLLLVSFQSGTDSKEAASLMTIETFFHFSGSVALRQSKLSELFSFPIG